MNIFMETIKITIETEEGILDRKYSYNEPPYEIDWQRVVEDMIDTLVQLNESEDEINKDAGEENLI